MNQLLQPDWLPLTVLASVLGVASVVGLIRILIGVKKRSQLVRQLLCPICVGVVVTWTWLLVVRFLGVDVAPQLLGVLLGGSAVGFVWQLEKYWGLRRGYLVWKVLAITAGLFGAYLLSIQNRWSALAAIFSLLVVTS